MKQTISNLQAEIKRQTERHDVIMALYYTTCTNENKWGDSDLYKQADMIATRTQYLRDALELIFKFQAK